VIYCDAYGFMTEFLTNAPASGFTKPLTAFCDGDEYAIWQDCMADGNVLEYLWMNFIQPTTGDSESIIGSSYKN
jgi:hypothetical protein